MRRAPNRVSPLVSTPRPISVTQVRSGTDLSASSSRAAQNCGSDRVTAAVRCAPMSVSSNDWPCQAASGRLRPARRFIHLRMCLMLSENRSRPFTARSLSVTWLTGRTTESPSRSFAAIGASCSLISRRGGFIAINLGCCRSVGTALSLSRLLERYGAAVASHRQWTSYPDSNSSLAHPEAVCQVARQRRRAVVASARACW